MSLLFLEGLFQNPENEELKIRIKKRSLRVSRSEFDQALGFSAFLSIILSQIAYLGYSDIIITKQVLLISVERVQFSTVRL